VNGDGDGLVGKCRERCVPAIAMAMAVEWKWNGMGWDGGGNGKQRFWGGFFVATRGVAFVGVGEMSLHRFDLNYDACLLLLPPGGGDSVLFWVVCC
jgi:hypothetical protein